jgi:hypothetical protein
MEEVHRKDLMNRLRIHFFSPDSPTYLNRKVIGTKAEVVPPTERGMLRPKVHFHMLEKVMVLVEETNTVIEKEVTLTVSLWIVEAQ